MQQGREVVERLVAWSMVVLVHLLVGAWFVRWRIAAAPAGADDALNVEFIVRAPVARPVYAANREVRSKPGTSGPPAATDRARFGATKSADTAPSLDRESAGVEVERQLDLRVPEQAPDFIQRDPLERATALDVRPTRFARAWVPAGNALEQAGFRSRAVGVALSAFGGPPRRCNEIERRLRKMGCLSLYGQELEDEGLRARANR